MSESALVVLTPIASEQAEFENWFLTTRGSELHQGGGHILTRVSGSYLYGDPNRSWRAWSARAIMDHKLEIPFTHENLAALKALVVEMEASLGTPSGDSK